LTFGRSPARGHPLLLVSFKALTQKLKEHGIGEGNGRA
jgi:hypothetical protein